MAGSDKKGECNVREKSTQYRSDRQRADAGSRDWPSIRRERSCAAIGSGMNIDTHHSIEWWVSLFSMLL
jgi:hypothetical protein